MREGSSLSAAIRPVVERYVPQNTSRFGLAIAATSSLATLSIVLQLSVRPLLFRWFYLLRYSPRLHLPLTNKYICFQFVVGEVGKAMITMDNCKQKVLSYDTPQSAALASFHCGDACGFPYCSYSHLAKHTSVGYSEYSCLQL